MQEVPPSSVSDMRTPLHPRGANRGAAVPYDFRHPTKLSREHVRLLQMAYETFARRLTTVLTGGLPVLLLLGLLVPSIANPFFGVPQFAAIMGNS